jgi:murein DD-endopeptidase MepM/ murein hydrolase activator NlpD
MNTKKYILIIAVAAILLAGGIFTVKKAQAPQSNSATTSHFNGASQQSVIENQPAESSFGAMSQAQSQQRIRSTVDPIPDALSRITKKPFGIYITPKTSPVQPERFQGYHTGADLETFPSEQSVDVPVNALCDGKLLSARTASGYGGVAVESCTLEGQTVTVIYGHLRLSSVKPKIGDQLKAGDFLAVLGTGFSSETDGERKHLHLGIHKGTGINILGYVQSQGALGGWLDPAKFLQ